MLLDTSGLQSDLLVVEARARGPFFWARVTKKRGTAKVARFTAPKKFSGSSKDCKIQSLLCDKASGNSKGGKIHCAKNFSARFSLYCATKLLGTAKVARFTVPKNFLGDWKVNVSKPVPIHGEHQSPAQWPHTRIFPGKQNL